MITQKNHITPDFQACHLMELYSMFYSMFNCMQKIEHPKKQQQTTTWFTQRFRDQQCLSKSNPVCPLALEQNISLIKH